MQIMRREEEGRNVEIHPKENFLPRQFICLFVCLFACWGGVGDVLGEAVIELGSY